MDNRHADFAALRDWLAERVDDDSKIEMLLGGDFTSFAESFHALCNKYAPKSEYVCFEEWVRRKKLARLHWNSKISDPVKKTVSVLPFQRKMIENMRDMVK